MQCVVHCRHVTCVHGFQALQLNQACVVAHTLAGHELVANGDLDQAIVCYRSALAHDPRHYNAWWVSGVCCVKQCLLLTPVFVQQCRYGLGDVYHRREKGAVAEVHFRRALSINPSSSVLRCHLGMVLHMSHKHEEALEMLSSASRLQPRNPQARFQRANVFLSLGRLQVRFVPRARVPALCHHGVVHRKLAPNCVLSSPQHRASLLCMRCWAKCTKNSYAHVVMVAGLQF